MANVKCNEWNIDIGIVAFRWGQCTDEDGQRYRDFGVGFAPGGVLTKMQTEEERTPGQWDVDAHITGALFVAGQVGSNGDGSGRGFGVGGTIGYAKLTPIDGPKDNGVNLRGKR